MVATSEFEFVEEHVRHLNEHVTPNQRESTWLANGAKNMKEILWAVTTILAPSTMLLSDTLSSIIAQRKRSRNYFSEPQSSRIIFCQQNAARLPVRFWFVPKGLNMLWEKGDPIYWSKAQPSQLSQQPMRFGNLLQTQGSWLEVLCIICFTRQLITDVQPPSLHENVVAGLLGTGSGLSVYC